MPELEFLTSFTTIESSFLDRKQRRRKKQERIDNIIFRQRKVQKKKEKDT